MKIELAVRKYEVEIDGYGKLFVSPLGAGAEAELRVAFRELDDALKETEAFQSLLDKIEAKEAIDENSEEYKNCVKAWANAEEVSNKVKDVCISKMRAVFSGENVEKFFQDFTYGDIKKVYDTAIKEQ